MSRVFATTAVVLLCIANARAASPEGGVSVEVLGLRSDRGQVLCELYASKEGFPDEPDHALAKASAQPKDRAARCEFPGVAPGDYAIAVIHDENGDGRLEKNFLGIPREGVGASNDAKGFMGPPRFDKARFRYPGGALRLEIHIKYL